MQGCRNFRVKITERKEKMMDQLELLTEKDFDAVWEVMEESFPIDERRSYEKQRELLFNDSYFLYGCRRGEQLAAFFAVWQLKECLFIEHFAVLKSCRNGGIGAELLKQLIRAQGQKLVLEVEPPLGELESRRIAFYKRCGFCLNGYDYTQPAMTEAGKEIPLLIMSYPGRLEKTEFLRLREELYRKVYKVGRTP